MIDKKKLINRILEKQEFLSEKDIMCTIDVILSFLEDKLIEKKRIEIRGFGSFSVKKRKVNSFNKEKKTIYFIYFRPSKKLKEFANQEANENK